MVKTSLLQALARGNAARMDRSMPFFNVDWIFTRFPNMSRDKVLFMTRNLQVSFIAGVAFVFLCINPPYKGADYENAYKSMYYKWTHNKLESSGQLYENQRVKRDHFYSPGGPVDPMVKVAEE